MVIGTLLALLMLMAPAVAAGAAAVADDRGTGSAAATAAGLPTLGQQTRPRRRIASRARLATLGNAPAAAPAELILYRPDEATVGASWRLAPAGGTREPITVELNHLSPAEADAAAAPGLWALATDARFADGRLGLHAEYALAGDAPGYLVTARLDAPAMPTLVGPVHWDVRLERRSAAAGFRVPVGTTLPAGRRVDRGVVEGGWRGLALKLTRETVRPRIQRPTPVHGTRMDAAVELGQFLPSTLAGSAGEPRIGFSRRIERIGARGGQRRTDEARLAFGTAAWSGTLLHQTVRDRETPVAHHEETRVRLKLPLSDLGQLSPELAWPTNAASSGAGGTVWHGRLEARLSMLFERLHTRLTLDATETHGDRDRFRTEGWLDWRLLRASARHPEVNLSVGGYHERRGDGSEAHYAGHARLAVRWLGGG